MIEPKGDPVLILSGPPCSGKTTVAEILAARSQRSAHLESDRFFRFIRAGYVEPWKPESHDQNSAVMAIVAAAAAGYAAAGYFTIIDGVVIPQWFLEPLRDRLRTAGHAVAYAVLRPSLSTCLSRCASRSSGELADRDVVEQIWRAFSGLGALERHVVADPEADPEEIAVAVAQRLGSGSLSI